MLSAWNLQCLVRLNATCEKLLYMFAFDEETVSPATKTWSGTRQSVVVRAKTVNPSPALLLSGACALFRADVQHRHRGAERRPPLIFAGEAPPDVLCQSVAASGVSAAVPEVRTASTADCDATRHHTGSKSRGRTLRSRLVAERNFFWAPLWCESCALGSFKE